MTHRAKDDQVTTPGRSRPKRVAAVAAAIGLLAALTACGRPFPADPDHTLENIRSSGVVRVGASHHPPQVVQAGDRPPTGTEVDLIEDYADHLGARVEWTVGSETSLIDELEAGELDMVIAGFEADSQWSSRAGLTRPYAEETAPDGSTIKRVIAVPAGENALMSDLERWLDGRRAD